MIEGLEEKAESGAVKLAKSSVIGLGCYDSLILKKSDAILD